jgi:hypothetical protein
MNRYNSLSRIIQHDQIASIEIQKEGVEGSDDHSPLPSKRARTSSLHEENPHTIFMDMIETTPDSSEEENVKSFSDERVYTNKSQSSDESIDADISNGVWKDNETNIDDSNIDADMKMGMTNDDETNKPNSCFGKCCIRSDSLFLPPTTSEEDTNNDVTQRVDINIDNDQNSNQSSDAEIREGSMHSPVAIGTPLDVVLGSEIVVTPFSHVPHGRKIELEDFFDDKKLLSTVNVTFVFDSYHEKDMAPNTFQSHTYKTFVIVTQEEELRKDTSRFWSAPVYPDTNNKDNEIVIDRNAFVYPNAKRMVYALDELNKESLSGLKSLQVFLLRMDILDLCKNKDFNKAKEVCEEDPYGLLKVNSFENRVVYLKRLSFILSKRNTKDWFWFQAKWYDEDGKAQNICLPTLVAADVYGKSPSNPVKDPCFAQYYENNERILCQIEISVSGRLRSGKKLNIDNLNVDDYIRKYVTEGYTNVIVAPRKKARCEIEGCPNVIHSRRRCISHGATKKRCEFEGCEKQVVNGGRCKSHGAKRKICEIEGCKKQVQKGGRCISHGATKKRCEFEGCEKQVQNGGRCKSHGAKVKICEIEGCPNVIHSRRRCVSHGAKVKRCEFEGCEKQVRNGVVEEATSSIVDPDGLGE